MKFKNSEEIIEIVRHSVEYEEILRDKKGLRSEIVEFMEYSNITVAEICKRSEKNGIEILKKATLYRLFDVKKTFSPRESTLRSLLFVLGEDLISNYQEDVQNNFIHQKYPCVSLECTSTQTLIVFMSQHVEKAFGVFRILGEVNHNACLSLCKSCFVKHREILIKPYSELMKILVDGYGKRVIEGLLNVNRTTIDRVLNSDGKIKFLDPKICDEIHRLAIGASDTTEYLIEKYLKYTRGELDNDAICRLFLGQNEYDDISDLEDNPKLYDFLEQNLLLANKALNAKLARFNDTTTGGEYRLKITHFDMRFESISCTTNMYGDFTLSVNARVDCDFAVIQFVEPDDIFPETVDWGNTPSAIIKSTAFGFWPNVGLTIVE
jgi:hypothetical protein